MIDTLRFLPDVNMIKCKLESDQEKSSVLRDF